MKNHDPGDQVVLSGMLFLYLLTPNFLCIKWYHNDQVIRHGSYSFSLYFSSVKKFRESRDKRNFRENLISRIGSKKIFRENLISRKRQKFAKFAKFSSRENFFP